MTRRSQAQDDAVRKAGRVSGERRRAAAKRRRDTEYREAVARAARNVAPAVEVVSMRGGAPFVVGKFYVIHDDGGHGLPVPARVAGPFDTATEAVERRVPGTHVARESA